MPIGRDSKVSGSTTRTETPGRGCPTVPRLEAGWKKPAARKSGQQTEITGAHSVMPYPSIGLMPNRSSKAWANRSESFSAPVNTNRRDPNCSGVQRRKYNCKKVGVVMSIVRRRFLMISPIGPASRGDGWYTTPTPWIEVNHIMRYPNE